MALAGHFGLAAGFFALFAARAHVALEGLLLGLAHGAEVEAAHADHDDHDQGEEGVEIVGGWWRRRPRSRSQSAGGLEVAAHCRRPAGDGGDDADGGGGGVDDVGQLGAGDAEAVRDGTHDRAHGEAVEIVVDEDEDPKAGGGEHGRATALDVAGGPFAVGPRAAGHGDDVDQRPQQGAEEDDVEVQLADHDGKSRFHGFDQQRTGTGADGVDDGPAEDAQEERGDDFLGQQGQGDGDDGGQQRQPARSFERLHDDSEWGLGRRIRNSGS